jgi:hypothetical protein
MELGNKLLHAVTSQWLFNISLRSLFMYQRYRGNEYRHSKRWICLIRVLLCALYHIKGRQLISSSENFLFTFIFALTPGDLALCHFCKDEAIFMKPAYFRISCLDLYMLTFVFINMLFAVVRYKLLVVAS